MRDASFIACIAQALLAFYLGAVLRRGATTASRRVLGRMLHELGAYATFLGVFYVSGSPPRQDLASVALACAELANLDLLAFALWLRRGAPAAHAPTLPRALRVAATVVILGAVGVSVVARGEARADLAQNGILVLLFVTLVAAIVVLESARRRGAKGARGYLFASAWLLVPVVVNLSWVFAVPIEVPQFRLIRDLCVLCFEASVLTSYLNFGHEPMSLRDRIVAGVIASALMLATAAAHLLLPLTAPPGAGATFFDAHRAALRLAFAVGVAALVIAWLAPRVFRRSVLAPLERLIDGLARAERGERVELAVENRDELGRVTRSFNQMVAALDDGRAALAGKVRELEAGQAEIVALNEELRRQIAARSRQLADALRDARALAPPIGPGVFVDGRYLVERAIGAGGMGRVFAARREDDGRSVALKVIAGGSPEDAVRFMREAEIAAKVSHENLVPVYDVGLHAGVPYLVMERLDGGSLADAATRFGDLDFVLPILAQIVRGVGALHARGVLHRDLKPANVLLAGDAAHPVAKIGDFGIAGETLVDELGATVAPTAEADAPRTSDLVAGTLAYMAPELARGKEHYGRASDVYAFGVLAWEALTGGVPSRVPAIILAMAGEPISTPSSDALVAPPPVASMIARAVSPHVEERPALAEILRAIEDALADRAAAPDAARAAS